MANTTIDLVGLDFASLKQNLITYMRNNTQFRDLDFEGSNMNVLMDVLAYNTYLNAFYTNMVASEMFLDTAQLRDSIVSHAKELNYTPRSFAAAKATIGVDITPSATNVSSVLIPKYTSFTSRVGSNTYTFTTSESVVVTDYVSGAFTVNLDVYEGNIISETFVVNSANANQRFVLSNQTVDTKSLDVTVYEDNGQTALTYTVVSQLYDVRDTSQVYFVQSAENQQYELVFGDNVFGRRPKDGAYVLAKYRACSGELANGAARFASDGPIDGHSSVNVRTIATAAGGAVNESIESIRFNAPRSFQAQNRAVTTSDYEILLKNEFSDIRGVSVFGGEDADPPQYGKVFISADAINADGVSDARKAVYLDFLKDKTPLTIEAEFIDPTFMYVKIDTNVYYNINATRKQTADFQTAVQAAISTYNTTSLEDFNVTMFYSDLVEAIDNADTSIVGNETDIRIVKRVYPKLSDDSYSFTIETFNPLITETGVKLAADEPHYGHTLTSSLFTYQNSTCLLLDDTLGNVYVAAQRAGAVEIITKVGTINYQTGKILVSNLNITNYQGDYIELFIRPLGKNITCRKNTILQIDLADVTVNVFGVKQ